MSAVLPSGNLPHTLLNPRNGPITRSRLRRTATIYAVVFVCGILLSLTATHSGLQAFGLGLVFPGGGFLHYLSGGGLSVALHLGCAVLSAALFMFSLVLWFGTGNQAAPFIVWGGAALLAGAMAHPHTLSGSWALVSGLSFFTLASGWFAQRRNLVRKIKRGADRTKLVGTWSPRSTILDPGGCPLVDELSATDLSALRYALDRALQAPDQFAGFDFIEQFQPSAIRYQINNLGYVLSLANFTKLPAMHGYLHDAQRNLIEKKKQHCVWKYWALESLWGNFRHAPDPIGKDNVMYSGWYAAQIGLFEAASGDRRYAVPGAVTLVASNGARYEHDYASIVKVLADNERRSDFCLFPCEPNWIYPFCNNQAALGIKLHDRLHGTSYWTEIEDQYRRRLEEEFIDVDGHLTLIRSTRTGFSIPGLSSSKEDAILSFWMHPMFPDIAVRFWEIARHELFEPSDGGLRLLPLKPWLDPGNYRFNTAYALGALGMAARELGDTDAADAVAEEITTLTTATHGGVLSYPNCSTWSHAFMLKMRVGRTNALHDLVNNGMPKAWREGPVIDQLPYPDLIPARAVSDGAALEAVLYPGRGAVRCEIGFAQLRPGQTYRTAGCLEAQARADDDGRLHLTIEIDARRDIALTPIA